MKKLISILFAFLILSCTSNSSSNNNEIIPLQNNFNSLKHEDDFKEAIRNNDLALIKVILENELVELNPPHIDGIINKPLAYAVQFGTLDSVKLILDYDVDINGQVSYGDTPLLKALENGDIELAKYLINQGADLNIPNSFGYSPFTGMCLMGYTELIQLSIDNGARINESHMVTNSSNFGSYNFNALQIAVKNQKYEIVKILLTNGGDPNIKTDGFSSLDIANDLNDETLISLLEEYKDDNFDSPITQKVDLDLNNGSEAIDDYQVSSDIVRLRHLEYYGGILNEYFLKTGTYPYQSSSTKPVYVYIANDKQENFTKEPLPFEHTIYTHLEFINEIESVLNRDIDEYFDPQYSPDNKPNFYLYVISGKAMYFAVHVGNRYSFSKKVSNGYYKIELSNMLIPYKKFYTIQYLKNNEDFTYEKMKTIKNVDYFKEREEKYINFSNK